MIKGDIDYLDNWQYEYPIDVQQAFADVQTTAGTSDADSAYQEAAAEMIADLRREINQLKLGS